MMIVWAVLAFYVQPTITKWYLFRSLKHKKYQKLIVEYLIDVISYEREITDKKGEKTRATVFQILLSQTFDYMYYRAMMILKSDKSVMSRKIDGLMKGAGVEGGAGIGGLMQIAEHILPQKHKGLVQYIPQILEYTAKKKGGESQGGGLSGWG